LPEQMHPLLVALGRGEGKTSVFSKSKPGKRGTTFS
jgi:hypothetical protein